ADQPLAGHLVAGFLALAGVLLVGALRTGEARLDGWFSPLFALSAVLCALLAMRTFAEEERTGSLELLLTAPLRPWQVVLGKLTGTVAVFAAAVAATVTAPVLVATMGNPDLGPVVTGYAGWLLLGVAYCAVGVAASTATASQLAAGAATAGLLLGLWFSDAVTDGMNGTVGRILAYGSPGNHVDGFLRGTIAAADVVYFVSMTVLAGAVAATILRARR
ncbi:MAG: ABC transporter permease, partial [Acidimicrobiales bacterium]